MPKQIPDAEFDAIVRVVKRLPEGASIDQIHSLMESPPPRRTLQRRLALLLEQGRLSVSGTGRGVRYRHSDVVAGSVRVATAGISLSGAGETYVPLSVEGSEIKSAIRMPLVQRRPVGYNRDFLDRYRPNHSEYLTPEIKRHLYNVSGARNESRPAGTYARQTYHRLLIDLSWNSSRLEGNTYSLLDTERLLQLGEAAEGKDALETQMILNHKAAIELLVGQASEIGFNRYTVLNLHALLSENLLLDPHACGRLRRIPVAIEGTVFHPLEVPQQIEEVFQQILDTAAAIQDPFEQAFFVMVQLPYLQPFEDVNKRVSRLAANISLIRDNLSPLSFIDVPDRAYVDGILAVYELNRVELLRDVFVWAYERSCARYAAVRQSLGQPDPFRIRYRAEIAQLVADVVRQQKNKKDAALHIHQHAKQNIANDDRDRFIEIVETELLGLHEGNIARYQLRPSEFDGWRKNWK